MSLVAYGSSDDSENSDNESSTTAVNTGSSLIKETAVLQGANADASESGHISDSDSELTAETSSGVNGKGSLDHMLKELPSPKSGINTGIEETDILEDEVKPKPSQVADVVKPAPRKPRQPVKITIPALPDSDDDEGPATKRRRPETHAGKSGLTAMLPAPMHAAKKETGRILLPYSLTKKSQPHKVNQSKKSSETHSSDNVVTSLAADYSSDSEEDSQEPVNFFSLNSSAESKTTSRLESTDKSVISSHGITASNVNRDSINDGVPTVALPPAGLRTSLHLPAPTVVEDKTVFSSDIPISEEPMVGPSMPTGHVVDQDAPLTFKGGVTSQRRYSNSSTATNAGHVPENMYYNMPYDDSVQYPEHTDPEGFKHDEEFLRLQGKKMQGKEEINLIDVNADDFTDPSEITKHLTEEQTYQSHRKKDNQPTGQQKRKHQIHYLAFQAKERELELKNQWSQNRQTKKQTQAKYGF